jgi:hypothetical protein
MRKTLMTSAALAAMTISVPAFAQAADTNTGLQSASVVVSATNPAKCDVTATNTAVVLVGDVLTDANGFPAADVSAKVAEGLNAALVNAWCTGANNGFVLSRTAFTTDGGGSAGDFQKGILYDVGVKDPSGVGGNENTEDGPTLGLTYGRFGATAAKTLQFVSFPGTTPIATSAPASANGATSSFTTFAGTRVIAGTYSSTVTIAITPGV